MNIDEFRAKHTDDRYSSGTITHLVPGLIRDAASLIADKLENLVEVGEKLVQATERQVATEAKRVEVVERLASDFGARFDKLFAAERNKG